VGAETLPHGGNFLLSAPPRQYAAQNRLPCINHWCTDTLVEVAPKRTSVRFHSMTHALVGYEK
jgi:hypothetical protein